MVSKDAIIQSKYIYDQDNIILDLDQNNQIIAKYVYGPSIDEPLLMIKGTNKYYYSVDGLGSVVNLTDATGNVVESYSYDEYGNLTSAPSQVGNRYLYTGREYDTEVNLYYYRARYYDPSIGRFLQTDPIGYEGGINLYTYVKNNPINWRDPSGLGAISDVVQGDLQKEYGDSISAADRKAMGDAFEQTAKDMRLADDFVKNKYDLFKSKEAKEKTREELKEKVMKELEKRAEKDPKLKELGEKLKEAAKKKK